MGEAGKKELVQLNVCQEADAYDRSVYLKAVDGFWEDSAFPGVLDMESQEKASSERQGVIIS